MALLVSSLPDHLQEPPGGSPSSPEYEIRRVFCAGRGCQRPAPNKSRGLVDLLLCVHFGNGNRIALDITRQTHGLSGVRSERGELLIGNVVYLTA
jgi:hypothetical protein